MADRSNKKRRADVDLHQDNWQDVTADDLALDAVATEGIPLADASTLAKRKFVKVARSRPIAGEAASTGLNPFAAISLTQKPLEASFNPVPDSSTPAVAEQTSSMAADSVKAVVMPAPSLESAPTVECAMEENESRADPPATDAAATSDKSEPKPSTGGFGAVASSGFGSNGFGSGTLFGNSGTGGGFSGAKLFGSGFGGVTGGSIFGTPAAARLASGGSDNGDENMPAGAAAPVGSSNADGECVGPPGGTVPLFGSAQRTTPDDAGCLGLGNEKPATGEEGETTLFSCDATLYEFGSDKAWKEKGRGELHLNLMQDSRCRLLLRQKGNLRLLLNAALFPSMAMQSMTGGRGLSFNCVNTAAAVAERAASEDGEAAGAGGGLYALRVRPGDLQSKFLALVQRRQRVTDGGEGDGMWMPPV